MKFCQLEYMAAKGVANGTLVLKYEIDLPAGQVTSPVCVWTVYKDGWAIGTYSRYGTYYANFLNNAIEGRLLRVAMDYAKGGDIGRRAGLLTRKLSSCTSPT